jgi:acetyltransferase-like isoleucine patch superfamily enzyme
MLIGKPNIHLGANVRLRPFATLDAVRGAPGRISIGDHTEIHSQAMLIAQGGRIDIGRRCSVHPFCVLYGYGGLKIGEMVRIAAHTVIVPANHTFRDLNVPIMDQPVTGLGITIDDDVWIGAGARILDGVHIHSGSVIAAGAVVVYDVPANRVAAGVPAKVIRRRDVKR